MFRVAKRTSPMSFGTWILTAFSLASAATAALQVASDRRPAFGWARRLARLTHVPAAISGAGIGTYTAALLSATSTPLWAAAPREMAMRFASSSMMAGAGALSLLERSANRRRKLDALAVAALSAELAATMACQRAYKKRGVAAAFDGPWGHVERIGVTVLGTAVPAALHLGSLTLGRGRPGAVSSAASLMMLGGSMLLRVTTMQAGNVSANRPEISFRFSQVENL